MGGGGDKGVGRLIKQAVSLLGKAFMSPVSDTCANVCARCVCVERVGSK